MTTPTRVASGVPTGGRFAPTSHAEPEIELDNRLPAMADIVADYLVGRDAKRATGARLERYEVDGTVELRKALREIGRERPAVAEISMYYNDRKKDDDLPDLNPPEGTVLVAEVMSGMYHLPVAGGRVVYRARSSFGNAITVRGGDVHILTDGHNRKVTVSIESDDVDNPPRVTISGDDTGPGSRVRVYDRDSRERVQLPVRETNHAGMPLEWMAS